jgi:hypothetical protein
MSGFRRDYDWANPRFVETDMDDWKPNGTGRKTRMSCEHSATRSEVPGLSFTAGVA